MAILAIDECMLREPGLLIPGKQPVGPVRVDFGHPLANSLDVVVCGNQFVWSRLGPPITNTAGYTILSPYGEALDVDGTQEIIWGLPSTNLGEATFFSSVRSDDGSISADQGIMSYYNHTDAMPFCTMILYNAGYSVDGFGLYGRSDANVSALGHIGASVSAGTVAKICSVYRGGNREKSIWVDGVKRGTATDNLGALTATRLSIGSFRGGARFDGAAANAMAWRRALSDAEVRSLFNDPYQFLVPA